MDRADDPYDKEACTKLIQEFWGGMLLTDNHNMTFVPNKITALLVDSESKIVLAGKFGQLDTTTTEKGVHIDMNTGDLKEQLLKMAREEGREARLCSKDKSVNLVFKFLPMTGNEDPENLSMGWEGMRDLFSPIEFFFENVEVEHKAETSQ